MPREIQEPSVDMHSEAWWIRLMDGELTAVERVRWEAHVEQCSRCREEWEAMAYVDDLMRFAPAPPALPVGFAVATVDRIMQQQRLRRLLTFLVGAFIVTLVTVLVLGVAGSALGAVDRGLVAVVAARQVLFRSVMHTVLALYFGWRALLPFVLGLCAVGYILLMPNGLLVTAGLIWLSGHRRAVTPVQA
jgi:predicted anti-sigma-YlaC factor YlaD